MCDFGNLQHRSLQAILKSKFQEPTLLEGKLGRSRSNWDVAVWHFTDQERIIEVFNQHWKGRLEPCEGAQVALGAAGA